MLVNYFIRRSKFGMGLLSINEDEDAAEALGVPTLKYKIYAFMLSAFFAAVFGAIFSLNGGGVDEAIFSLEYAIDMIVMIVVGGLGTVMGPMAGSVIYFVLYDLLLTRYPNINLIILGVIVAFIVLFAPEGVIGVIRKMKYKGIRLRDLIE